uniref:Uncharacterized protein n=1 Tax=Anguilla anguilla TaxID=7936 RepID=A0A0E9TJ91_ANGAN
MNHTSISLHFIFCCYFFAL